MCGVTRNRFPIKNLQIDLTHLCGDQSQITVGRNFWLN